MLTAETERLAVVLDHAQHNFFAGQVGDDDAVHRAESLGLVERYYQGAAGFLSLAKLKLTDAGKAWLEERER